MLTFMIAIASARSNKKSQFLIICCGGGTSLRSLPRGRKLSKKELAMLVSDPAAPESLPAAAEAALCYYESYVFDLFDLIDGLRYWLL